MKHEFKGPGLTSGRPLADTGFRRGMWVSWRDSDTVKVGILNRVEAPFYGVIDVIAGDGTTLLANVRVELDSVNQATYSQIPSPRKKGPKELFTRMGYK